MNLKGGTGKTVTAINTAAILAQDYGRRVLLVDADSQENLTEFVSSAQTSDRIHLGGIADLLRGQGAAALATRMKNVKILPADETLMALDVSSTGTGKADPMALEEYLDKKATSFEHCIIDCPPAFSAAAMAALIAADEVVIPMKVDAFGIRGMANLLEQIRNMRRVNEDLEIAGVLPTMVYPDPRLRDKEAELRQSLAAAGIRCFHHILWSKLVDEMTFEQRPLIEDHKKSRALREYRIFVRDLLGGEDDGV